VTHRIELRDGAVVGVATVPATTAWEADEVGFRAAAEVWERMLEAEPRPHYHGLMAARRHGLVVEGSEERRLQYFPAIRRLIELLRTAQSPSAAGASVRPPRPAGAAGRFDAAVGRYVYLDIDGVEYRVYFEETGPADGIPVLLQHTAGADGRQWRHFLEAAEPGLNRSSQRLEVEVLDGTAWWVDGDVDGAAGDAVAGSAADAAGCRTWLLGQDRGRALDGGRGGRGGGVGTCGRAVVPRAWGHALYPTEPGVRPVSVLRRT
jgi:hypothetical protein